MTIEPFLALELRVILLPRVIHSRKLHVSYELHFSRPLYSWYLYFSLKITYRIFLLARLALFPFREIHENREALNDIFARSDSSKSYDSREKKNCETRLTVNPSQLLPNSVV
jgi:hypothetical protein